MFFSKSSSLTLAEKHCIWKILRNA
jgi:hypothetical protein